MDAFEKQVLIQGKLVDDITVMVEETADYAESGLGAVQKAEEYQKKVKKVKN